MTQFVFDQIPSGQLLQIEGNDTVLFHGGPASGASVVFGMTDNGISTVTVTFAGHTVEFDTGVVVASANSNLIFDDGSHLIMGGPRNESLDGGAGNDALFGGDGTDTLSGHAGSNLLQGNQGDDVLTAESGADTIYGGQGDDMIATGLGAAGEAGDFAQGNKGADTLSGGAGADSLLGGQGNDSIQGGAGADFVSGDRGADTMTGGAGADIFHVTADGSVDRITDFHLAEGDRVQIDPGMTFQLMQQGADTVVTLGGGGSVVLVGVDMSTLHGDWIFAA